MITAQIILLFFLCFLLIIATNLIVRSLKTIARASHLGAYGITAFLLAVSTSLPELIVSVVAAFENNTSLILGNIIGSNIADILLIVGGAAIVGGRLRIGGNVLNRDLYLTGATGLLPIFLIADGTLSSADGVVLLVIYFMLVATFLRSHQRSLAIHALSLSPAKRLLLAVTASRGNHTLLKFVFGVMLLLFSSHFIVQIVTALSASTHLSSLFLGLFLVSIGTSLPELAFELRAVSAGQISMALGDLLGSIVANSTLILGIASLIHPLVLSPQGLLPYGEAILTFTLAYTLFLVFSRTKKRLDWWEGIILILFYVLFIYLEYYAQIHYPTLPSIFCIATTSC